MGTAVAIHGSNSGLQVGINHGLISAEFHFPPDLDNKLPAAYEAALGSYADQHEDECFPGTRIDILRQIREWAFSPQGPCIFWLNGMAGTGKSTISRTMAKSFSKSRSLGASFFFRRGKGDRGNAIKLFPTIARHLAITIPQIIPALEKTVRDHPGISTKAIREQFERLLLHPLQCLNGSDLPIQTLVIVIDALDECEGDDDIRLVLQLLPQLQKLDAIRLRILLSSRPEYSIRLGFSKIARHDHQDLVLHEIPEDVIKHDLYLYLNYQISYIRQERQPPLPSDWPGDTNLQRLVELSVPSFIFAATICRIFKDPDWDPVDSLTEIIAHENDESKLDGTYLPVLDRLLNRQHEKQKPQLVQDFHKVVGTIVILEIPLSVTSLSRLLGVSERLIHTRLNSLHSVLNVSDDETLPVRLFHLSFRDFLLDPETREKTPFWVNEKEMHYKLTIQCLLMCQSLRRNICGLPNDGTRRVEVDQHTINRHLPPELQYACRYWAHHLMQCTDLISMMPDALLFLQRHFLHWVEAMSLLGLISEVSWILNRLRAAIPGNHNSKISQFLHDAKRFLLKNRQIVDESPLQLYCAGLVFAPRTAIIRREFKEEFPPWICQLPRVQERWNAALQTLEGHSASVGLVAFSPNGRLLLSASEDNTVRTWDPATGALQQTLEGHSNSVAFSPDDRLLASAPQDNTVRLWDTATGALQETLEGHSDWVNLIAFSPGGRLLASASYDNTVRIWNPATGALQQTLEGYSSLSNLVAFSPDGRLLASASWGNTVRLWDTTTGALQQTLEGHSGSVGSVAFSPNCRLLAFASEDHTVRLWDTMTGTPLQTLEGHLGLVKSVAFSPDGQLLASASWDKTIRLWDPAIGALRQTLKGHSNRVVWVTFSPDGQLLASASHDNTVRIWNTATGALQQTLEGHLAWVNSVAFSPDGRLLASASHDSTVRLWDIIADEPQPTLEGDLDWIKLMTFSPDGRLLASASHDSIVRIWNTATGALQQTLEGHSSLSNSLAFSPDGRLLASASEDHTVRIWNPATGRLQQTLEGHSDWVNWVTFSPDGRILASASEDHTVRIWNPATGRLQQTLEGHLAWVDFVIFSPDSRLLASASRDETVRLWDPATGVTLQTLEGHSGRVDSVAFSPNGRLLASASQDDIVRLWDTTTGALQQMLGGLEGYSDSVNLVAFSPNGQLLASTSSDKTMRLWDPSTGAVLGTYIFEGKVTDLNFSQGALHLSNFGTLNISSSYKTPKSNERHMNPRISIEWEWIKLNDEKALWLPIEYRPTHCVINGKVLALANESGRVSFIGFEV